MAHDFKVGDHVEWNSEAGRVRRTLKKKTIATIALKKYTVHLEGRVAAKQQTYTRELFEDMPEICNWVWTDG